MTKTDVRAEYLAHIEPYKASGLSIKKYCELHGLLEHKFNYYRHYENKKAARRAKKSAKFAKVVVKPSRKPEVSPPVVDPAWLAQFVDQLLKIK